MHEIDKLSPLTKSTIRGCVFEVLARIAASGAIRAIRVKRLFLLVADELVKAGVIERPAYLGGRSSGGQEFAQLIGGDQAQLFPDYELPAGVASLVRLTIWELYLEGVLAPATRESTDIHVREAWVFFDAFDITPYGLQIITDSSGQIRVYDPDGYIANFTSANPQPDPEMMRYLMECLSVFKGGHLLATVILLAISSERLIEHLAERLRDALGEPSGSDWYNQKFANKRDISARFQSLVGKLMDEYGDKLAKEKLKEGFQSVVTLSFDAIRLARNDIAHLGGREFSWNEVSGLLHNFVQYFRYVNRIIALLVENPKLKSI